ncbi:cupin domain-containing protein [Pseudarthrobacter sp. Fe7]|nr:cupin domain-containing protein [Pseudarthrobacter sp. Fe7]
MASTEAYVVLEGSGRLETLDSRGFNSTPLSPGVVLWFTPGTVHRAINESGDLKILVVMQNAGLPEHGDAVMTFPPGYLADSATYRRTAALEHKDADAGLAAAEEAARRRRDLALEGYFALKQDVLAAGPEGLEAFHAAAARLVSDRTSTWAALLAGELPARRKSPGNNWLLWTRRKVSICRKRELRWENGKTAEFTACVAGSRRGNFPITSSGR